MIDVSGKTKTLRFARARAELRLAAPVVEKIRRKEIPKGDPLETAKVAAVQAAKNTSALIPYCHPLPVDHVGVSFRLEESVVRIETTVQAIHRTGVEMEAVTAAAVAALTVYDMVKMFDAGAVIAEVALVEKRGGKSEFRAEAARPFRAAVVVCSDSTARGARADTSGAAIRERLSAEGGEVVAFEVVPDEPGEIREKVQALVDSLSPDLLVTTGGTGLGPRDRTPEAMEGVLFYEAPGIAEAIRVHGGERTPFAMLSRGRAGVRNRTLVVNLPGSEKAVRECLDALFPGVFHAFAMIQGGGHPEGKEEGP